jgi:phage terminase Nu1 subunit (DNA packaging protein)
MTQAQFARHRGVSKGSVTNWKNAGLLVMAEGPNGKPMVDVVRSELKLNANIDPMRGRPPTGGDCAPAVSPGGEAPALPLPDGQAAPTSPGQRTIADERADLTREQRIGQAMKNAQLAAELVPLIEAQRRVAEVGRATRERIHAWFRGIAEQLAATSDVRTIMVLGEEGIDDVFAQLARAAAAGDFAADDEDDAELTAEEEAEMEAAAAEVE